MGKMSEMWDDLWGEPTIKNPAVGLVLGHLEATASIEEFRLFVAYGTFQSALTRTVTPVGVLYVSPPTT